MLYVNFRVQGLGKNCGVVLDNSAVCNSALAWGEVVELTPDTRVSILCIYVRC